MEAGIPETQIKMLERWQSDVSQGYVRTPPEDIAKLSSGRHLSANFLLVHCDFIACISVLPLTYTHVVCA